MSGEIKPIVHGGVTFMNGAATSHSYDEKTKKHSVMLSTGDKITYPEQAKKNQAQVTVVNGICNNTKLERVCGLEYEDIKQEPLENISAEGCGNCIFDFTKKRTLKAGYVRLSNSDTGKKVFVSYGNEVRFAQQSDVWHMRKEGFWSEYHSSRNEKRVIQEDDVYK